MIRREYNEIYGYLPSRIVNLIPDVEKLALMGDWLQREPTKTGYFITYAVFKSLGDEFTEYLVRVAIEVIKADDEEPTREKVLDYVESLIKTFATDTNILYEYVDAYHEEGGELPGVDDEVKETVEEEKKKQARDPKTGRFLSKKQ